MELETPEFLTTVEMAALFQVHRSSILRWWKQGHLEAIRPSGGKVLFPVSQRAIQLKRRLMDNV
jgi:excisionase family DNA binding protein